MKKFNLSPSPSLHVQQPKKDTESKNVDAVDGVFVEMHIESLITA